MLVMVSWVSAGENLLASAEVRTQWELSSFSRYPHAHLLTNGLCSKRAHVLPPAPWLNAAGLWASACHTLLKQCCLFPALWKIPSCSKELSLGKWRWKETSGHWRVSTLVKPMARASACAWVQFLCFLSSGCKKKRFEKKMLQLKEAWPALVQTCGSAALPSNYQILCSWRIFASWVSASHSLSSCSLLLWLFLS